MASLNRVTLLGNLGKDPETRTLANGSKTTSFSLATSETWNDKASGERKSKTTWHRIVIWNDKVGEIAERFLKKGSSCLIEGQIESRKYTDKDGAEKEITEIVIPRFSGGLTLLGDKSGGDGGGERQAPRPAPREQEWATSPDRKMNPMDDDIPF